MVWCTHRLVYSHVSYVEPSVDEQNVPGDDEARQRSRQDLDIGQAKKDRGHKNLVGQGIQETSQHRCLAIIIASDVTVQL